MLDWIMILAGLAFLLVGGDLLVKGAVALSIALGISALVVSLTVVALGTSAPELLIGIQAALDDVPVLALGNVVGSNIANVLLVLGLPALMFGFWMKDTDSQRSFYHMIFATAIFVAFAFTGLFVWWHGIIFILLLFMMFFDTYLQAKKSKDLAEELESEVGDVETRKGIIALYLIGGLVLLPLGANLLIEGAENVAFSFGVSEAVIGLTLVALGTSLPELATTLAAAYRKEPDVAFGNVIGSNMFNLLAIIGVTSFFSAVPIPRSFLQVDLWVMVAASLFMIPFVLMRINMGRVWGTLFVLAYVAYILCLLKGV